MDEFLSSPTPPPLPDRPDLDGPAKKTPGRPPLDPVKRALNDERYAQVMEFMQELPQEAREFRFAIYDAMRNQEAKKGFRALQRILFSQFKEQGLKEPGALGHYLLDKHGPGRYYIEPLDAHNHRVDKIPAWVVTAGDPNMDGDDDDFDDRDDDRDDDRPRRRRSRSRRDSFRDEDLDDPIEQRANVADLLVTNARAQASTAAQATKSSGDMMSMLLVTNQQAAEARSAEERRREESRAEERRREEVRAEERRREQMEERRREEERERETRKEEREREERQRREDAEQRRRDDERRNQDHLAAIAASNRRTEMVLGGLTTLAPILVKVFEKKDDPVQSALLTRMTAPPPENPIMVMLLKSMIDKGDRKDGTELMFQQMAEMSKLTSQMTADQMRSMMAMSSDMNREMMKKAMDMMLASPQGQTPEGKNFIEQVMGAIAGAAEIVKTFVPAQPAIAQPQQHQQPRRGFAHQRPQQQPQPAQAQAQPAAATPEQAASAPPTAPPEPELPKGVHAVLACLMAIHQKQYKDQAEYQQITQYLIGTMPVDLRMAILEGNEIATFQIAKPYIDANAQLTTWIGMEGVVGWMRTFVPQLAPHILAMHGDIETQRAELAAALHAQANGAPPEATQAPAPVVAPDAAAVPEQPPVVAEAAPSEAAPVPTATEAPAPAAEPPTELPPAAAGGSHLDPNDPG